MAPAWRGDQWASQGALPTARTAVHGQRRAVGRAHRPSVQARDAPVPQGLPYDPKCTRPRCGERPEYLATTQVHLYGAGTNGRPLQQRYTLTGSASIAPPRGNTGGWDPSQRQAPPPPTQPHHTPTMARVVLRPTPKVTEPEGGGGGARKGAGEGNRGVQHVLQHATCVRAAGRATPRLHAPPCYP